MKQMAPPKKSSRNKPPAQASGAAQTQKGAAGLKAAGDDEELVGDSAYRRAKDKYGHDQDAFYEFLRQNRLNDPSLCLGYYLMRSLREENLNQADIAERTRTRTDLPITRSFLSAILGGRSGIRPDTYVRIADAVGANPLEFFIAEGWIDPAHIATYQVPNSSLLLPIAQTMDRIDPAFQQSAVAMVKAVLDTVILQQQVQHSAVEKVPSA